MLYLSRICGTFQKSFASSISRGFFLMPFAILAPIYGPPVHHAISQPCQGSGNPVIVMVGTATFSILPPMPRVLISPTTCSGMPSLTLSWCLAVLPLGRHVLTAGMSALKRWTSVPYAFGVSFINVCSGTSIQGDFSCGISMKYAKMQRTMAWWLQKSHSNGDGCQQ